MRVAIVAVVVLGASQANAETFKPTIVWQDRVITSDLPEGSIALTSVSHTLYLNDCKPNGCTVSVGSDDSRTNRSSIPVSTVTLNAYGHSTAHWNSLVQCVKDTFAPFDINVVTTDPGSGVNHFEVMIGGSDTQLRPGLSAGGVAPYVSCNAVRNNGLSFVFPETTSNLNYLCGAVVQEATHIWGLDHELNAKDPMTYLDLGSLKRFQNDNAKCGEDTARSCRCGAMNAAGTATTQNSFRYMTSTFGLKAGLANPTVELVEPKEGQWLKAGFAMVATIGGPLDPLKVDFTIDTTAAGSTNKMPFAVNSPTNITGGPHVVTVTGTDMGDRTAMAMVNVNVMSACAAGESCTSGTHCLGGFCQPGADITGGLGGACAGNGDCITGLCGTVDNESKCTASCDPNMSCPSGFDCIDDGGAGVCWPASGGGCSAGGSPAFLVGGLGLLLLGRRRRR